MTTEERTDRVKIKESVGGVIYRKGKDVEGNEIIERIEIPQQAQEQ
jgi:hypothetical protein